MKEEKFIPIFKEATEQLSTLIIKYKDRYGVITGREVEPYSIQGDVFFGYDVRHNQIRKFKLQYIMLAFITNRKFSPRWEIESI